MIVKGRGSLVGSVKLSDAICWYIASSVHSSEVHSCFLIIETHEDIISLSRGVYAMDSTGIHHTDLPF
jgi:hypothetical protein